MFHSQKYRKNEKIKGLLFQICASVEAYKLKNKIKKMQWN
jgi:hypothetical protein